MDPSQSSNQPPGAACTSTAAAPPSVCQDNPAENPPYFPSQPVPQGSFAQGSYPGQSVPPAPLVIPMPDYTGCSIFTMFCCCFPLGTAALVYSLYTRIANYSGQRKLAERNSKTARTLNNMGIAIGTSVIALIIILFYRN